MWLLPRLEQEIRTISNQLVNAQKSLGPIECRPIHGDYHPRNIIVSPSVTTAIDFEEARMGDPAFDIGYFIAQTKMSHGTLESLPEAQDVFLDEYKRCCSQ